MRRCACLVVLLGFWLGSIAWASQKANKKVDFSGTWILDESKTDKAPTMQRGGGSGSRNGGMGRGGGNPGGYPGGRYPGGGYPGGRSGGGRPGRGPGDDSPGAAGPLRDALIVIEQTESELRIIRKTGDPDEKKAAFRQVFLLDGGESVNPGFRPGEEIRSRTSWNQDKLVTLGFQKGSEDNTASEIVIKQELSLSKDSKTLTFKTTQSGARGGFTFKQVFVRQAGNPK